MNLDYKQPKRIATKDMKKFMDHHQETNLKLQSLLVPMLLVLYYHPYFFKDECLNYEWTKGGIPNTIYGVSPQGWIDHELIADWLLKLFIKNIPHSFSSSKEP